ncbi:MAG: carbohydrate-binding domain-containing protein, partial [Eubacteriales bacterium]|nr:carbohydrate-binding domain-containing protein [Eubacteriales bacterium]
MKRALVKTLSMVSAILLISTATAGCSATQSNVPASSSDTTLSTTTTDPTLSTSTNMTSNEITNAYAATGVTSELFTSRDLEQTVDLTNATSITLQSGTDVTLNTDGIYVLSGEVTDVTVVVEAPDDAKVQIVLDGVSITNESAPAIYIKAGDKVFVTTTSNENTLQVTGTYAADGETNLDAVIFSKSDLTLNGTGTLNIVSANGNGISAKDDLVITGGVLNILSSLDGLEANDAILINGGTITIDSGKDGLQCINDADPTLGYICIISGTLTITAADDGIRGNRSVQIDGGAVNIISSTEGIEANAITFNAGEINIYASDDGINATQKVTGTTEIVVNGGTINVEVGSGDTDAFDSNGNITINGGTINVIAPTSSFDPNGVATLNGGTVTINGEVVTTLPISMMGG